MADQQFNVVFRGELTGNLPEHAVKQNLAALFKMSQNKVETLFTGKPVVVKKGADEATARKFESAFRKAGAVCELQPVAEEPKAQSGAPSGGDTATGRQEAAAARDAAPAAGASAGARPRSAGAPGGGSTTAAGDPNNTVVDMAIPDDLGGLAIDESEAPHEPRRDRSPPDIDTSGLDLATDEGPLEPQRDRTPPEIDTSGLRLEDDEPGGR